MLINGKDMKTVIREDHFGGEGITKIKHLIDMQETPPNVRMFTTVELDEGCSFGSHPHENETEIYYILKGRGITSDNGIDRVMEPGDLSITLSGQTHSMKNIGEGTLEFVAVVITN